MRFLKRIWNRFFAQEELSPLCNHSTGRWEYRPVEIAKWNSEKQKYAFRLEKRKFWVCSTCGSRPNTLIVEH